MCGEIVGRGRLLPLAATARYLRDRPTVTTTEKSETDTTVSATAADPFTHAVSEFSSLIKGKLLEFDLNWRSNERLLQQSWYV